MTNDDIKSLSKDEADKFYTQTHQMQDVITKYQAENKILVHRVEQLTAEGKEDVEARLKEMSHLLELEKLERSNIQAELDSIKVNSPNYELSPKIHRTFRSNVKHGTLILSAKRKKRRRKNRWLLEKFHFNQLVLDQLNRHESQSVKQNKKQQ